MQSAYIAESAFKRILRIFEVSGTTSQSAHCGNSDKTNVPTNFTLHLFVRGIHSDFGTHLKTCL